MLISLALFLSGCEYLRLLQFKHQLQQIDRYFHIERSADGLTLSCQKPILTPDDARLMFEDAPTVTFTENDSEHWRYDFRKRYIRGTTEPTNFDFAQIVVFEQGHLTALRYTAAFLTVFDNRLLQRLLQAVGQGRLNEQAERLEFQINLDASTRPTQRQFEAAWGQPYTIVSVKIVSVKTVSVKTVSVKTVSVETDLPVGTEDRHLYVYALQTEPLPDGTAVPLLTLWVVFDPQTGAAQRLTAEYHGRALELSFSDTALTGFLEIDL